MASEDLPIYPGASGQPQTEDAPPAYNNTAGPQDLLQQDLGTQIQMRGELVASLPSYEPDSMTDQMTAAST